MLIVLRCFLLCLALLLGVVLPTAAQQPTQFTFTHYTTANGLPSNLINCMVQDEEGYMWFATVNGISRYDGYRFQNFSSPSNNPNFKFDNVVSLFYDQDHNIWFITSDYRGGILNARDFSFQEVDFSVMKKSVFKGFSFLEMADGRIILQEFRGPTYRYDAPKKRVFIDSTVFPLPENWLIGNIVWDTLVHKYWLTTNMGLALYNPFTKEMSYAGHNLENDAVIEAYKNERDAAQLFLDKSNNINFYTWLATDANPYIHSYNRTKGKLPRINLSSKLGIGYHEIMGFMQQRSGRVWVYGLTLLAEWLPDRKNLVPVANEYRTEQSLKFDNIRYCFEDGELNVWLATDNGLFLFNPDAQLFNSYGYVLPNERNATEHSANAVLQMPDSNIYVGCWGAGLFRFSKTFTPLPVSKTLQAALNSNPSIWDLHRHTKTGCLWIALQGGDLVVYNPATDEAQKYHPEIFESRTIRQITEDSSGNLWLGTQHGLIVKWDYAAAKGNPTTGYTLLQTNFGRTLKLLTDSKGFVWAATLAFGLYKIDPNTGSIVHRFTQDSAPGYKLTNDVVTDLMQYNDNTMIAVTKSLNLIDMRTNAVSQITTAEGLPSNTGACLERDRFGILWLGLENGLCRINLRENLFTLYNRRDGIDYDNFNPAGAFKLQDGRMVFATDHNVLVFEPQKFLSGTFIPPDPEISSVTLANNPLSVDSLLRIGKTDLRYDNTSITIQFSILSFLKQKQPNYAYMMEGFDADWKITNGTNEAAYSYLPPGTYTFKVKAVNQNGMSNGRPTQIQIIVHPPFWRTWWFYGLVTLALILILYLIDKERQKKQSALQAVRTQIAGDLHEEINVTLSDINLLSEIAKLKADKDIDRSKDYIDQISTKSRTMIESMDDILWSIDPENDSMERMLLRLYEFADGVKKTTNLDIDLSIDNEVRRLTMDMKTRHEFLLFFKDAVAYVIHYSVCATIYIGLEYGKGKLAFKLLAQCNELEQTPALSAQLEYNMHRRVDALHGLLDIMGDRKSISIFMQAPV